MSLAVGQQQSAADRAPVELTALLSRMQVPLEVTATKEKGKHVIATRAIAEREELLEEAPLLWWPFDALLGAPYCAHCSAALASGSSVSCSICSAATYCNAECLAAGAPVHAALCGLEKTIHEFHASQTRDIGAARLHGDSEALAENTGQLLPITVEAVARCVATLVARLRRAALQVAGEGATKESVAAALDPATLRAVFDAAALPFNRFVEPPTGVQYDEEGFDANAWVDFVATTMRPRVKALTFGIDAIAEAVLAPATLHTFIGQLALNAQAINRAVPKDGEKVVITVAAGLYTLQSSFNHSCAPNCEVVFSENSADICIRATQPIAAGEEACITYIPELYLAMETAQQRRERLRPYLFTCNCVKCASEDAK